jgi:hypothetical protein
MITSMEHIVEWEMAGETEVPGENLSQCRLVHRNSHMTWTGVKPELPQWEASD